MRLTQEFLQDHQGRRFPDVLADARISFRSILEFFDEPDRQRRLVESELHHDRPALAGVIRELEARPDVDQFLRSNDGHVTTRFRQAVGVIVRIIMERHGWRTTGRKGSLGVRASVPPRTTSSGAYHNTGGLALWFTRAERYELATGMPYRSVAKRSQELKPGPQVAAEGMPDVERRTSRPGPTGEYYHRTTRQAAEAIMKDGFRDDSQTFETGSTARGTYFSDSLDSEEAAPLAFGDVVVAVELPVDVAERFFHTDDQGYREYLIAATILNGHPRRLLPQPSPSAHRESNPAGPS